jgi:hypothetical protein
MSQDPFAPPEPPPLAPELDDQRPRRPAAGPDAALFVESPSKTRPVRYKKPTTSFLFPALAVIGLVSVVGVTARLLRRGAEAVQTASAAPPPPPKPVEYKELGRQDGALVTIEVSPKGARLLLDGAPLPSNPVWLPRGSGPRTLAVAADGYAPHVQEIDADGPRTLKVKLKKVR